MTQYRKLTRKERSLGGHTQIWMAPDHLLLVNSSRFTEKYQRFALADIQAIVVSDGPDRIVLQTLAVLGSLAWGAGAFAVDLPFGKYLFALTGFLFLTLAIRDIARGPRCRCFLHTAVNRWPLLPVSRQRIARRFLASVIPAIEVVQGALSAEQITEIAATAEPPEAAPLPEVTRPRWDAAHVLFALFLLDAVLFWIAFRWPILGAGVILPTAVLGELLLAVMALIQGRSNPLRISYVLIALTIACVAVDIVITGRLAWNDLMSRALQGAGPPVFTTLFAPARQAAVFGSTWRSTAGLLGLTASYLERRMSPPTK
jgi:hypothetical protein